VPLSDGAALAWLYQHGEVVHRDDDEREAHVEVRMSDAELGRFRARHAH
jgi:GTP-binding protein HflX